MSAAAETLLELASYTRDELRLAGIEGEQAGELTARIIRRLVRELGGCQLYMPRMAALDKLRRDAEIAAAHDGTYHGENGILALARRHGLSSVHVYRILAGDRRPAAS